MCLVRPALLYLNVHVLKAFYEQINYYYYYYYYHTTTTSHSSNNMHVIERHAGLYVLHAVGVKASIEAQTVLINPQRHTHTHSCQIGAEINEWMNERRCFMVVIGQSIIQSQAPWARIQKITNWGTSKFSGICTVYTRDQIRKGHGSTEFL